MQYHHFQNFVITKCCWSVISIKVVALGKHVHSKQRKPLLHNFCSFVWSLCTCPASSPSTEHSFQHCLAWSNISNRRGWAQRKQKNCL